MSFLLYLIGFVVFVSGIACLATLIGVAQTYVAIGAAILLVVGVVSAIARARTNDSFI